MFNILILEDNKEQLDELEKIFKNLSNIPMDINIQKAKYIDEFFFKLSSIYFHFLSSDQQIPEKKNQEANFFDIFIFNTIERYNSLSLYTIYTAFPQWKYANELGLKNVKYYSKEINFKEYKNKIEDEFKEYFKLSKDKKPNIFKKAIDRLPKPFGNIIEEIINSSDEEQKKKKIELGELVLYFISIIVASIKDIDINSKSNKELLNFLNENKNFNGDSITAKEMKRLFIDDDFLNGLESLVNGEMTNENLSYWLIYLQFFVSHIIATEVKVLKNPLGMIEVKLSRVGNTNRKISSFINKFNMPPQQSRAIFVFRDINKNAEFLDISKYLKISNRRADGGWKFTFFNDKKF